MYNQTISTTTEICTVPDTAYCNTWVKTTETTYQYFDMLILIFILITPFVLIRFFKTKK